MRKRIASNLNRELRALRSAAQSLDETLCEVAVVNGQAIGIAHPCLSRKARASLVLQGLYMGFMRQLKPRQKAQVRRVREAKGVRAAIARAKRLAA